MTLELGKRVVVRTPAKRPPQLPLHHCPGCHYGIILRLLNEVLEDMELGGRAIFINGAGCSGPWSLYLDVDTGGGVHGPASAMASAMKRIRPSALVFSVQGDGEIGAIGLGSFVSAAIRGEKITCIALNNGCYGMTGGQLAPTTLLGIATTTTSGGRMAETEGFPFHAPELVAPLPGVAYAARGSVHRPANYKKSKGYLRQAFQSQLDGLGFSVVEFVSACPPNWKLSPVESLKFIEEKVLAEYPLGEFKTIAAGRGKNGG